jgi:hypothetical protein
VHCQPELLQLTRATSRYTKGLCTYPSFAAACLCSLQAGRGGFNSRDMGAVLFAVAAVDTSLCNQILAEL